jgi:hypothetical protein
MIAAGLAAVLIVGAFVVLANPRHRAFYFGEPISRVLQRATGSRPALTLTEPQRSGLGTSAVRRGRWGPDAEGRLRIPLADPVPWRLPAEGVPPGWEVKEFSGRATVGLERSEGRLALRLRSEQASFALLREVVVDLRELPYLSWWWKVVRLPAEGDVREPGTDDQAAQVYVVFPRWPSPRTNSEVIGYVWDSRAPVGTRLASRKAENVRIVVAESGTAHRDVWQRQQQNVLEDYVALFGREPPRVGHIALMIDSNDTRSVAESLIADLTFSRGRAGTAKIPTSMLR